MHKIQEPDFGPEESKIYGEALGTLGRAVIRYMLNGIVALNAYAGIWCDTEDLVSFVSEKTVTRVLETPKAAGFETEISDPLWLSKTWKGDFFADIVHADHNGTGFAEESRFPNTKETTVLGRRVLVVPAEELLLSRIFVASRERWDPSDVLHLIFATRGARGRQADTTSGRTARVKRF